MVASRGCPHWQNIVAAGTLCWHMAVIIYSTPTCPYCKQAKAYLQEKHVAFDDMNVSEDMARQQEMRDKSGQMGVPVIDVNGTIIVGFNPRKIDAALGAAA